VKTETNLPCRIFAVHDEARDDSLFFTLTPETLSLEAFGQLHLGADIEAIDIHPFTDQLFASSGKDGKSASELFLVDSETGELTLIGKILEAYGKSFREVSALSFRNDGTLWGYANKGTSKRRGLIQIDPNTGFAQLIYKSSKKIEAIAWDPSGNTLWLSKGKTLYTWTEADGIKKSFKLKEIPGYIQGLEFSPDGLLMLAVHHGEVLTIYSVDVETAKISKQYNFRTSVFYDVESLAWSDACGTPAFNQADTNLKKTGPEVAEVGEDILYQFEVQNSGQLTLQNLNINDPLLGGDLQECEVPSLEPGESFKCSANYTIDSDDPVQLTNIATVNAETLTGIPVSASDSHDLFVATDIPQPDCLFYAVHDKNRDNSQFLSLSPNGKIKRIGPEYAKADIEGLDINPISGAIIVSSGKDGEAASELFQLNPESGELTIIGTIRDEQGKVFKEVASLAFHQNGSLWGFAGTGEQRGIIQINPKTAVAGLVFQSEINAEGIAWTDDTLWLIAGKELYSYTPDTSQIEKLRTLSLPKSVESLFSTFNGLLITAIHKNGSLRLMKFNPETGKFIGEQGFKTYNFYDIEGLSWPQWCGEPELTAPHCP